MPLFDDEILRIRRKTNTYAKRVKSLQRTMEVHWVIHNFIRVHFTTQEIPAVKLGILETGLACLQVFRIRQVAGGATKKL